MKIPHTHSLIFSATFLLVFSGDPCRGETGHDSPESGYRSGVRSLRGESTEGRPEVSEPTEEDEEPDSDSLEPYAGEGPTFPVSAEVPGGKAAAKAEGSVAYGGELFLPKYGKGREIFDVKVTASKRTVKGLFKKTKTEDILTVTYSYKKGNSVATAERKYVVKSKKNDWYQAHELNPEKSGRRRGLERIRGPEEIQVLVEDGKLTALKVRLPPVTEGRLKLNPPFNNLRLQRDSWSPEARLTKAEK